jgi:uncharacterized protein YhdP
MTQPNQMRSVFERMTNPTPDDLQASDRAANLTRFDVARIIDTVTQALQQLANRRDDVTVNTKRDEDGWTIRIDMPHINPSQLRIGGS